MIYKQPNVPDSTFYLDFTFVYSHFFFKLILNIEFELSSHFSKLILKHSESIIEYFINATRKQNYLFRKKIKYMKKLLITTHVQNKTKFIYFFSFYCVHFKLKFIIFAKISKKSAKLGNKINFSYNSIFIKN